MREAESSPRVGVRLAQLATYADTLERDCRQLHAQFVEGRDAMFACVKDVRHALVPALTTAHFRQARVAPGSPRSRARACKESLMVSEEFELYLIRHGLAEERGEKYPDDTKRPLTSRGIQRLKQEGKALVTLDVTFDVMLTSPLVRTRQTAETLAEAFREPPPIVNSAALVPGGTHNAIIDELAKQSHRREDRDRRPRARYR